MIPRAALLKRLVPIALSIALIPALLAPSLVADGKLASEPDTLSFKLRWFTYLALAGPPVHLAISLGLWPEVNGRTDLLSLQVQVATISFAFWLVVLLVGAGIKHASGRVSRHA